MILSAVLGHWPDFFIILVLLVANAGVGFSEEHQAGKAIAALKAQLAIKARVLRDGKWITPPARELVPGDVIRMRIGRHRAGRRAAAGRRPGRGRSVRADGRVAAGGRRSRARRCSPARSSARARSARWSTPPAPTPTSARPRSSSQEASTVSHFQRAVLRIGTYLIMLALALVALIIAVSIVRGDRS